MFWWIFPVLHRFSSNVCTNLIQIPEKWFASEIVMFRLLKFVLGHKLELDWSASHKLLSYWWRASYMWLCVAIWWAGLSPKEHLTRGNFLLSTHHSCSFIIIFACASNRSWMMLCGIFLLPLGLLKSLHMVSVLSFWCTMSHLVINAVILGYCLLEIGDWGWAKVKWSIDMGNFPISLGVIVFSYTSQIFLPTLEGNMIDRSKFEWMLDWSHIAAAVFKALFGYLCFLTFQNDTQQVITNNLHSSGFKGLVNFFLVIKAILSYPLPYYAACELLERAFFRGPPKTKFPTIWALDGELKVWGFAFRVGVVLGTVMMAIFIPHFSILMGFIGSFTGTMLSFIWPCYFHLKIKGHLLDDKQRAWDYFIISLGILFGVIGIYDSGSALIEAFEIGLPF